MHIFIATDVAFQHKLVSTATELKNAQLGPNWVRLRVIVGLMKTGNIHPS